MGKKKKPKSTKLDLVESIVTIFSGLANIGFIIYSILKG